MRQINHSIILEFHMGLLYKISLQNELNITKMNCVGTINVSRTKTLITHTL